MPDAIKRCSRCGNDLPATAEFFGKSKRDGLFAQCKACRKLAYQGRQMSRRKERYASDIEYRAKSLSASKSSYKKHRDKYLDQQRLYSQRPENIEKARIRAREWQVANPDRVRVNVENRRAALAMAPGRYSEADVFALLKNQSFRCFYCGFDVSGGKHTVDHKVPISRGGSNWPENLVIACSRCNAIKGNKTPVEFEVYLVKGANHGKESCGNLLYQG